MALLSMLITAVAVAAVSVIVARLGLTFTLAVASRGARLAPRG